MAAQHPPITIDFGSSPISWAEARRRHLGRQVRLYCDNGEHWIGVLSDTVVENDGVAVFHLELGDGREVGIGCDTVLTMVAP